MAKAKTRARKQGTREGGRSMWTCRLTTGEGSGRFMTVGGRVDKDIIEIHPYESADEFAKNGIHDAHHYRGGVAVPLKHDSDLERAQVPCVDNIIFLAAGVQSNLVVGVG
jgi:hypothetical protein